MEFFPGVFDIGVFCKQKVPLKFLYTKIFGYLEEITYAKFNELKELGHPSLYHYNNQVNIHDARFTSENHYFVLFGEFSCVNYDITSNICFSHRRMDSPFEENMQWELQLEIESVDRDHE